MPGLFGSSVLVAICVGSLVFFADFGKNLATAGCVAGRTIRLRGWLCLAFGELPRGGCLMFIRNALPITAFRVIAYPSLLSLLALSVEVFPLSHLEVRVLTFASFHGVWPYHLPQPFFSAI